MTEVLNSYLNTLAIIAIDPGMSGAIAILNRQFSAQPLPIAGKELDLGELSRLIQNAHPLLAVVEKVH